VSAVVTVISYIIWRLNARAFRKHQNDDEWWGNYNRYKERLALFFITIMYMPLARVVLMNFKCHDEIRDSQGREVIEPFPNEPCRGALVPIQLVSVVCAFGYIIGIPSFFARLIRRGVKEISLLHNIHRDLDDIKRLKQKRHADGSRYRVTLSHFRAGVPL
jgi:hypothetical protein